MNNLLIISSLMNKSKELVISLIALIVVFIIGFLILKSKETRKIVAYVFSSIIILSGIFTAPIVYEYFTLRGGVFGSLKNVLIKNELKQEGLKFQFSNFNLIESENEGEYTARFSIKNQSISLLDKIVFVNDSPTLLTSRGDKYIFASYTHSFLDENLTEICKDTLYIKIAFNSKTETDATSGKESQLDTSTCILTSKGGLSKAKYWNRFLEKNDLIIEIKQQDYTQNLELVMEQSNQKVLEYYVNDELYAVESYELNEEITLMECPTFEKYNFFGWFATKPYCAIEDMPTISTITRTEAGVVKIYSSKIKKNTYNNPGYNDAKIDVTFTLEDESLGYNSDGTAISTFGIAKFTYFDRRLQTYRAFTIPVRNGTTHATGLWYAEYEITFDLSPRFAIEPESLKVTVSYEHLFVSCNFKIKSSGTSGGSYTGEI